MIRQFAVCVAGLLVAVVLGSQSSAQTKAVRAADVGIAFALPSADWASSKLDQSGVLIRLYSPSPRRVPRFGVLRFPALYLPKGMATREAQITARKQVKKLGDGETTIDGRTADTLTYHVPTAKIRTVEYGVRVGAFYYVLQVVDRDAGWAEAETKAAYDALIQSVRFREIEAGLADVKVRKSDAAALWKLRAPDEPKRTFEIVAHDVTLVIEPDEHSLRVVDDFTVQVLAPDVESITVASTMVKVDAVEVEGKAVDFKRIGSTKLEIALPSKPAAGSTIAMRFRAHHDEYVFASNSKMVSEISVYGQVAEASCYSSHVHYYPTDRKNDAAMRMSIDVPAAYTAVTGGNLSSVTERETAGGVRRVFTYETAFRTPRQLPFGFAVGRYAKVSGTSDGGLSIDVYYLGDHEAEARQRLDVVLATAKMLEAMMGPLPWGRVAFCHVQPKQKEMGVALPGLVLFSDAYFADASKVKLEGASLVGDDPAKGLLIFADELSHQWNFYALPLPNEFAEGVSTFTNLLYVERIAGAEEYVKGVRAVAGAYLVTAETNVDVAIADPALYRSPMYRTVAFCKVPAVLHSLRRRLGDETFFRIWREAFAALRGRTARYREVFDALGAALGEDLEPFFDAWFFRPGHPRLDVRWHAADAASGRTLTLAVEQTQPGRAFALSLPVVAEAPDGTRTKLKPLALGADGAKRQTFTRTVAGPVERILVDPAGDWPVMRAVVRAGSADHVVPKAGKAGEAGERGKTAEKVAR